MSTMKCMIHKILPSTQTTLLGANCSLNPRVSTGAETLCKTECITFPSKPVLSLLFPGQPVVSPFASCPGHKLGYHTCATSISTSLFNQLNLWNIFTSAQCPPLSLFNSCPHHSHPSQGHLP